MKSAAAAATTTTVSWAWTYAYLNLLAGLMYTETKPHSVQACGKKLADLLQKNCRKGYNFYNSGESYGSGIENLNNDDQTKPGITQECCLQACTYRDLLQYCYNGSSMNDAHQKTHSDEWPTADLVNLFSNAGKIDANISRIDNNTHNKRENHRPRDTTEKAENIMKTTPPSFTSPRSKVANSNLNGWNVKMKSTADVYIRLKPYAFSTDSEARSTNHYLLTV